MEKIGVGYEFKFYMGQSAHQLTHALLLLCQGKQASEGKCKKIPKWEREIKISANIARDWHNLLLNTIISSV